jgi:hypothetical protein
MSNSIQYTSRTYNTVKSNLNSDDYLKDRPEWFKNYIAGILDVASMINNAASNENYIDTAFTYQSVYEICRMIDYTPTFMTTSTGTLLFYLSTNVVFPVTFTATDLKALSEGTVDLLSRKFECRSGTTINSTTGTFTWSGASNILTVATDFEYTGHKLRFTTTGTLPTGLSLNTDYYTIYVSATEIKVATSLENALNGTEVAVTGAGAGTHTWTQYSFTATAYQQETQPQQNIGNSDGVTEFQKFDLPDDNIILDTLEVEVSSSSYTRETTLVNSDPTDKDYRIFVVTPTKLKIMFGDGTYGAIPPSDTVYVDYATGGGLNSNISAINRINIYNGGNSDIVGVTNVTTFTGGADTESLDRIRILAPLLTKASNRFVTEEDGETLAENYGGLSLVQVNRNEYGILTCQVVGIANGGGNPSAGLRTDIQDYLIERTLFGAIDVRFEACTLTTVTVDIDVRVLSGYAFANIEDYIEFACKLFFSETGKEITDRYNVYGVSDAITLINTIFSYSFSTTDNTAIMQILDEIQKPNQGYRNFEDTIQELDFASFITSAVDGIDYITVNNPAFPLTYANDEISTHTASSFTITEV